MRLLVRIAMVTVLSLFGDRSQQPGQASDSSSEPENAKPATGFLFKTVSVGKGTCAYCVYVPPEYTANHSWPIILFLHGSGERGDDGFLQTEVGIARAIRRNRHLCPAIVVMPQCGRGRGWTGEMLDLALRCVEHASGEYRCDPDRVYLTGLSMGGAGAWLLGRRIPEAFAAIVPICGFLDHPRVAASSAELEATGARLAELPIWCFHGSADTSVPVERSRELVEAVRTAGGRIKYTEVADAGHNVWDRAYDSPALWRWLLAQKRSAASEKVP